MTAPMCKSQVTTIVVMAVAVTAHAQSPDPQWTSKLNGHYEGELVSNGNFLPVSTFLKPGQSSGPTGYYVFIEPGNKQVSGELTDCTPKPSLELACQWHDPYGSGRVVFTFAQDLRSFKGRWSNAAGQHWLPWNGTRQQ